MKVNAGARLHRQLLDVDATLKPLRDAGGRVCWYHRSAGRPAAVQQPHPPRADGHRRPRRRSSAGRAWPTGGPRAARTPRRYKRRDTMFRVEGDMLLGSSRRSPRTGSSRRARSSVATPDYFPACRGPGRGATARGESGLVVISSALGRPGQQRTYPVPDPARVGAADDRHHHAVLSSHDAQRESGPARPASAGSRCGPGAGEARDHL